MENSNTSVTSSQPSSSFLLPPHPTMTISVEPYAFNDAASSSLHYRDTSMSSLESWLSEAGTSTSEVMDFVGSAMSSAAVAVEINSNPHHSNDNNANNNNMTILARSSPEISSLFKSSAATMNANHAPAFLTHQQNNHEHHHRQESLMSMGSTASSCFDSLPSYYNNNYQDFLPPPPPPPEPLVTPDYHDTWLKGGVCAGGKPSTDDVAAAVELDVIASNLDRLQLYHSPAAAAQRKRVDSATSATTNTTPLSRPSMHRRVSHDMLPSVHQIHAMAPLALHKSVTTMCHAPPKKHHRRNTTQLVLQK